MTKHRGFPSGLPGHGHHFTIRRPNQNGATPLKPLQRLARPNTIEQKVDAAFLHALWHHFGDEPFERGNLDAGRLNLLFGREVIRPRARSTRPRIRRCCGSTSASVARASRKPSKT